MPRPQRRILFRRAYTARYSSFPTELACEGLRCLGCQCAEPWPVGEHKTMVFTVPPHIWQASMAILIHLQTFRRGDARTASGRLPTVSRFLLGISLPSLGLTRFLPLKVGTRLQTGIGAYGKVGPESLIHQVRNYFQNTQTFNQI